MENWTEDGVKVVVTVTGAKRLIKKGTHQDPGEYPCFQVVDGKSYIVLPRTSYEDVDRLIDAKAWRNR